jgi:hypothetical protein
LTPDADAVLAEFGGEQPHLMRLIRFGGGIRDVVGTGEHPVLARDVDEIAAETLPDHDPRGLAGNEE